MNQQPLKIKTAWACILFGILLSTAPNWINDHHESNYDAPWVHPSLAHNK